MTCDHSTLTGKPADFGVGPRLLEQQPLRRFDQLIGYASRSVRKERNG